MVAYADGENAYLIATAEPPDAGCVLCRGKRYRSAHQRHGTGAGGSRGRFFVLPVIAVLLAAAVSAVVLLTKKSKAK